MEAIRESGGVMNHRGISISFTWSRWKRNKKLIWVRKLIESFRNEQLLVINTNGDKYE